MEVLPTCNLAINLFSNLSGISALFPEDFYIMDACNITKVAYDSQKVRQAFTLLRNLTVSNFNVSCYHACQVIIQ